MAERSSSHAWHHAIVIGGGIAGLLAARVLADRFETVTLIERDGLATGPEPRKGVPQGHHVHGLLLAGQKIVSQLFPDLLPALLEGGAVPADMGLDFRWHHHAVWKTRFRSGIGVTLFTRPYLEWQIAQRVQALPNLRAITATVERLRIDAPGRRVLGVEIRSRADGATVLDADLVVDASGRGSQIPQWLEASGYGRPAESIVKVDVAYASRLYAPQGPRDWKALLLSPRAPFKRTGAVFAVEGERWLVTLGGFHGERPPTDDAGFLAFARGFAVPDLADAIAGAVPLTPIASHRFPANLRRHYEGMRAFPERLVVMGDAACSFNPIYGQGMTVSALEAHGLAAVLDAQAGSRDLAGVSRSFHEATASIIDTPWRLTTSEDFRQAETTGPRPRGTALLHWYTGRLHERCAEDPSLALSFFRVMHMMDPPTVLFRPSVMMRVFRRRRPSPDQSATGSGTATARA